MRTPSPFALLHPLLAPLAWLQASLHDEGSCWVPAVLRPAIILSHWGRTDEGHKGQSGCVGGQLGVTLGRG